MTPTATQSTVAELEQALAAAPAAPALPTRAAGGADGGGLPAATGLVIIGGGFAGLATAIRLKQAGRDDFVARRPRRRRRRHLARQHLPGLPLRRALAPVLALVRAEPALERVVLPAGRDPRLHARPRRALRPRAPTSTPAARSPAHAGIEADGVWETRTALGTVRSRFLVGAVGGLVDPKIPDDPGPRQLSRQGLPLGPLGPRPRPERRARRRRRHRRLGDPVRAPDPARRRGAAPVPAHAALDHAAHQPRDHAASSGPLFERLPALQRIARGGIYWARELVARGLLGDERIRGRMDGVARKHLAAPGPGPGAAREADPRLRDRLQADPALERLLPGARPRQRRGRHRGRRRGPRQHASSAATAPRPRSTRSSSAPASTSPTRRPRDLIHGVGGRSLREVWGPSMHAHRGTTIAGFPNMFMLGGPHTGIGHTSLTVMIEAQVGYVIDALRSSTRPRPRPHRGHARKPRKRSSPSSIGRWRGPSGLPAAVSLVPGRDGPQHDPLARLTPSASARR